MHITAPDPQNQLLETPQKNNIKRQIFTCLLAKQ